MPPLPSLVSDNPAYSAYEEWLRSQAPLVSDEEMNSSKLAYDAALAKSSTPQKTGWESVLATSLGAALPAIIGGATGGIEGAGFGGEGAVSAMKAAQARWEADKARASEAVDKELAYTARNLDRDETLKATGEREKRDGISRLFIASGGDIEQMKREKMRTEAENARSDKALANQRDIKRMELDAKQKETIGEEEAQRLLEVYGIRAKPTWTVDEASKEITATASGTRADKTMGQEDRESIEKLKQEGRAEIIKARAQMKDMDPEAQRQMGLALAGHEPDFSSVTNRDDAESIRKAFEASKKIEAQSEKLDQGERRLGQFDRQIAQGDQKLELDRQKLDYMRQESQSRIANTLQGQVYKEKELELRKAALNQAGDIAERRIALQQNALALRSNELGASDADPTEKAAAKARLQQMGADPLTIEAVDHIAKTKDLQGYEGEYRRRASLQNQLQGKEFKLVQPATMKAAASAVAVAQNLKPIYEKVVPALEKAYAGKSRIAKLTKYEIMKNLPTSEQQNLDSWLNMGSLLSLYNDSGKTITDTERQLFTDFMRGKAIVFGDLMDRLDYLTNRSTSTALLALRQEAMRPGSKAQAKDLAESIVRQLPKSAAVNFIKSDPELFDFTFDPTTNSLIPVN